MGIYEKHTPPTFQKFYNFWDKKRKNPRKSQKQTESGYRPRAHARPDARRRPRPFSIRIFEKLTFFNSSIFWQIFLDIFFFIKELPKKNQKRERKAESEYRARQQRGSDVRYHQHVPMRLRSAPDGAEHCACQWLRVPCVEVVKQCVVPWTTGVLPTSTFESKVCKARPGQSARTKTRNSRSSSARSARQEAEWSALPAVRPRLAMNSTTRTSRALRAAKTTPSTLVSAPASITLENGGNNGIEKATAEEP